MADTPTTSRIHLVAYPLLGVAVFALLVFWHNTKVKDAAAAQVVTVAKATQASTDKQATTTINQTEATLQQQNKVLKGQLAAAKTTAQQVALLNQEAGTKVEVEQEPSSQAENPSPRAPQIVISPEDLATLAKQGVDFKQEENQVAADQLIIAAKDEQIVVRDNTIKAQGVQIIELKGGSKWHRFFTATKHVAEGAVLGTAIGIAIDRKLR
jgi:hypothetical protein